MAIARPAFSRVKWGEPPVTATEIPALASLQELPYINDAGRLPQELSGKIGVYAICDRDRALQYVGYSRNIHASLKQHLARCPQACYWLKAQTIDRPNRTLLEDIRQAWIAENGSVPPGNGDEEARWERPIDARSHMNDEERAAFDRTAGDDLARAKCLKQIARRVEAEILEVLQGRGVTEEMRFNPKLKSEGLLDLK